MRSAGQFSNTQQRWRPIAAGARARQMTTDGDRKIMHPSPTAATDHIVDHVDGGAARRARVTQLYGRRAPRAAAGSDGGSPPSTRYPAAVSRHTNQSGLMGLCTQGVAQPWATHDSMVFLETSRPSRSKSG